MGVAPRSAVVEPTLIVWWHEAEHDELPAAYAIRWVELVGEQESRSGLVRVSSRTADPTDCQDAAVAAELHYQLERRLGALIKVEPAIERLPQLRVERRLAVRGCRTASVAAGLARCSRWLGDHSRDRVDAGGRP